MKKKKKTHKKITAEQVRKIMVSEKAWNRLLESIKYNAEVVLCNKYETNNLPELFETRLMKAGFSISKKQSSTWMGAISISWEKPPSIKEYDKMIKELTEKRDELKKERLTKKLAGI